MYGLVQNRGPTFMVLMQKRRPKMSRKFTRRFTDINATGYALGEKTKISIMRSVWIKEEVAHERSEASSPSAART